MRQEMRGDGVPPNLINYNLAVRALGKGGDWERATGLLKDMKKAGVSPDDRTFNAAIEVGVSQESMSQCDRNRAFFSSPLDHRRT